MIHRLSTARRNPIPYLGLFLVLAVGVGGGYAYAASKTKTITVCADKKTGVMHFKSRNGRCSRGQTRVTWNQQGPQGAQGPTGQAGAAAVSIWANVANDGSVVSGQGLSVQHVSTGSYQVTVTDPACAHGSNAPVVTVSGAAQGGAAPYAWYGSTGLNEQFMVFTGDVGSSGFTASDHTFTVLDSCM